MTVVSVSSIDKGKRPGRLVRSGALGQSLVGLAWAPLSSWRCTLAPGGHRVQVVYKARQRKVASAMCAIGDGYERAQLQESVNMCTITHRRLAGQTFWLPGRVVADDGIAMSRYIHSFRHRERAAPRCVVCNTKQAPRTKSEQRGFGNRTQNARAQCHKYEIEPSKELVLTVFSAVSVTGIYFS